MPVDILSLPSSSLSTKWKETYASASINQRFVGVIAPGIYRGLLLAYDPSLGDRTVLVQPDAMKGDHVAVYETSTGYSISYRDSTSGAITLQLTAYSGVDVVICIAITYVAGSSTTGTFRIYSLTEFNALPTSTQGALVVLGTVTVPASGAIPAANISLVRRTLASANLQNGMVANSPIVRNPSFELGATNAYYPKSSLFWEKLVLGGYGTFTTQTLTVASGMKAIELVVAATPFSGSIYQQIGIETSAGEQFYASISIKQVKLLASGSFEFFMEWSDVNDVYLSTSTQSVATGVVDSSFRTVSAAFSAPAGATSLRTIGVRATSAVPTSTGTLAFIDSVNVFVQPRDAKYPYPADQAFKRSEFTSGLTIEDPAPWLGFGDPAVQLSYSVASPVGEGSLSIDRRDNTYDASHLPPALKHLGRIIGIGSASLTSIANALNARISAPHSNAYPTLIFESMNDGVGVPNRLYFSSTEGLLFTTNLRWATDGQWYADTVTTASSIHSVIGGTVEKFIRAASGPSPWTPVSAGVVLYSMPAQTAVVGSPLTYAPWLQYFDSSSTPRRRVVVDHLGFAGSQYTEIKQNWSNDFLVTYNLNIFNASRVYSTGGNTSQTIGGLQLDPTSSPSADIFLIPLDIRSGDVLASWSAISTKATPALAGAVGRSLSYGVVSHEIVTGALTLVNVSCFTDNSNAGGYLSVASGFPASFPGLAASPRYYFSFTHIGTNLTSGLDKLYVASVSVYRPSNGWAVAITTLAAFSTSSSYPSVRSRTFLNPSFNRIVLNVGTAAAGDEVSVEATNLIPAGTSYAPGDDMVVVLDWAIEGALFTGTGITATNFMGFSSTAGYAGIVKIDSSDHWWLMTGDGTISGPTFHDTGVIVSSSIQRFRLEAYGANAAGSTVRYDAFIDGVLRAEAKAPDPMPTGTLGVKFSIKSTAISAYGEMWVHPVTLRYRSILDDDAV